MIKKTHQLLKKLEFGILELLIGTLMVVGLIGYFWKVSADLEWIDHTVSFILFTFLFYQLNITSILFGKGLKKANAAIVISFFFLFFKDILSYTSLNVLEFGLLTFLERLYEILLQNFVFVNLAAVYIGITGILLASIYLTKSMEITHPSFTYALFGKKIKNRAIKLLTIFVALLAFYYFVYSLVLEWLEFTLDDPIIITGIAFYVYSIAKRHEKFHPGNFIFKIGDFSTRVYGKFVSLFHYKKTLPLAISGLLMLHVLSDLGVFAYSMIFSKENFYLKLISEEHQPFLNLLLKDMTGVSAAAVPSLSLLYLLNIASLIILLTIPMFIWLRIFTHAKIHFRRIFLFLIYASFIAYLLMPLYTIKPLTGGSLAGVDILSQSQLSNQTFGSLLDKSSVVLMVSCISILGGLIVFWLSGYVSIKKEIYALTIFTGLVFFSVYLYYFSYSLIIYFYGAIASLLLTSHFLIAITFIVFLLLSVLFYVGGYLFFLYETIMEFHRKKWSEPIDEELVMIIKKIRRKQKIWKE